MLIYGHEKQVIQLLELGNEDIRSYQEWKN